MLLLLAMRPRKEVRGVKNALQATDVPRLLSIQLSVKWEVIRSRVTGSVISVLQAMNA